MKKEDRIQSDLNLSEKYAKLSCMLRDAQEAIYELADELNNNIQGICKEKTEAMVILTKIEEYQEYAHIQSINWKELAKREEQ